MKHKFLKNQIIREHAKKNNVRIWEIADKLHIGEATMTRRLRQELPDTEQKHICDIIDEIANSRQAACTAV